MESLSFDLAATPLRAVNQFLHKEAPAKAANGGLQVTI